MKFLKHIFYNEKEYFIFYICHYIITSSIKKFRYRLLANKPNFN